MPRVASTVATAGERASSNCSFVIASQPENVSGVASRMRLHTPTHTSHISTRGPAISLLTSLSVFPQNEQRSGRGRSCNASFIWALFRRCDLSSKCPDPNVKVSLTQAAYRTELKLDQSVSWCGIPIHLTG